MHLLLLLYLRQLPLSVQQLIFDQRFPDLIVTHACQSSAWMRSSLLDVLHGHGRCASHVLCYLVILLRLWLAHLSNRSSHRGVYAHLWLAAYLVHVPAGLLLQTLLLLCHSGADEALVVHPLKLLHLLQ